MPIDNIFENNDDNIMMLQCHLIDYHPVHNFLKINVQLYDENGDLKLYHGYKCADCNPKIDIFFENNFIVTSSIYITDINLLNLNSKEEMKEKYKQHNLIKIVDSKVNDFVNKLDNLYDGLSYIPPSPTPFNDTDDSYYNIYDKKSLPKDIQEKYKEFNKLDDILQHTSKKFDELINRKGNIDDMPELITDSEDDEEPEPEPEPEDDEEPPTLNYMSGRVIINPIVKNCQINDSGYDSEEDNDNQEYANFSGLGPIKCYESNSLLYALQWEDMIKFHSKYSCVLRELLDLFYGSYILQQ